MATDPGGAPPQLSIVIPAFNEAGNLDPVVRELAAVLAASREIADYEILVIDDGSTDATAAEAAALASRFEALRVITHDRNRGLGAALRTGYGGARGEFVTLLSGDGEIDPHVIVELYGMAGDADLVLSRRVRTPSTAAAHRQILSSLFSRLTAMILGMDPSDLMGIYLVRRSLLQRIELHADTGLMNVELAMKCMALGCRIKSGEMRVRPRLSGESKVTNLRTVLKVFREMFMLRLRGVRR